MTDLRIRYTVSEASLLGGMRASTDYVRTGLYLAVVFTGVMGWTHSDAVSSWKSLPQIWELVWQSALAGMAFGTAMMVAFVFVLLPIRARGAFRQNPLIFGEMELEADDSRLIIKGPRSSSAYVWGDLRGFKETRQIFVIALSKSASFAIPKADMTTATEGSLRAILEAHLRRIRSGGLT